MNIRTRFAPSPTGYLHVGGARTALFSWLYAKKHHGEFILRIEDTDQERSKPEFTQDILSSLKWLGINSDITPIFQSKRNEKYQQAIQKLIDQENAYYCYCSKDRLEALREEQIKNKQKPRYDGFCRTLSSAPNANIQPVIRFKNPLDGAVTINDRVRGNVVVQNSELDDLILARSDGSPTYHLSVVVDDIDLEITHVIRGEDHLNNTPRQINIYNALNKEIPEYAHLPLIHGKDGRRLSKRHGAVSVNQYKADGYLPEAFLNYLVRLGWSHGDQEIFSLDEMLNLFDLSSIQQSAATFDFYKLLWVNHQYMMNTSGSTISTMLNKYFASQGIATESNPGIAAVYDVQKERFKNLLDLSHASRYFYNDVCEYDEKGASKHFSKNSIEILKILKTKFEHIEAWSSVNIHTAINATADQLGLKFGKVAPALRLAVTGCTVSPSIDITLELLGPEKTSQRIDQAIEYIIGSV